MSAKANWVVRLGRQEWIRFTYERTAEDELQLLGSVASGARIGALALNAEGQYLQINGDHVCPLNASQLRAAVAKASKSPAQVQWRPPPPPATDRPPPQVIVKRRRVPVLPH